MATNTTTPATTTTGDLTPPATRTQAEINQEYTGLAMRAGDAENKIRVFTKDLVETYARMEVLSKEPPLPETATKTA